MPEKTLLAFADHGEVEGDKVTGTAAQAQEVFDALERVGIDLTDVFLTGGRGRRQVREVVEGAARHRQGPARRREVNRVGQVNAVRPDSSPAAQ